MKPIIIAHRGASGAAPENTIAAFQEALDQGCDAIELDIHLSADGKIVVIHDDTIDRTTNGSGAVREMKASELKQFDAGSWFDERFAGERIPLLEEVLDLVPASIMLNIEIKNIPAYNVGIERRLVELLQKKQRVESVIISSFDHHSLYTLKHLEPSIRIGLLYSCNFVDVLKYCSLFEGMNIYSLHPSHKVLYQKDLTPILESGLQIYPYTVNQKEIAVFMLEAGVSGLITNYPAMMKELVQGLEE